MSGFNRLIKNAISNVINGFSNVILGIIISPLLIKILSINDFAIWSLALQVGAFFSLIGFTGQLSVARYITLAKAQLNELQVHRVIKYGLTVSSIGVLISIAILYISYVNFYSIFEAINHNDSPSAPTVFFIVSLSFILGLITSSFNGYFTGIERNEIPAIINFVSRIILGIGIYFSAKHSMLTMAWVYLTINMFSYVIIYCLYRSFSVANRMDKNRLDDSLSGASFGCFLNYCLGVFVFNLSTFLIVNLNSVLVGKFAFKEYAYYALSITLVTAVVGFLNAAITPVLQPLVKMVHADDKNKLDRFVYMLSQTLFYLTFFILIVNFVVGDYIMKLWVGNSVAIMTYPIFSLLLLTNLTRLISSPLGLVYLAKGKQNEIMYLPLLEGIVSVALTYAFVRTYGIYASAISLAISTILIMLIYSFKLIDISAIETSKGRYRLLLAGGPLILFAVITALVKLKLEFIDYEGKQFFLMFMLVILLVTANMIFKNVKIIKKILGG
ncbi:hypothetical protein RM352_000439 [Enterobacter kobei]|uniref:oligosaccharide flippase family protein n=1 Tax=Enterobacter kobei TaxID=208224 RepID=UPI00079A353E|nr:oligosaccharide flippase family protein [Enterobacter kobei]ELE9244104.1 hypothetical protein [Enterobacter kobei]SAG52042.1 polysaccharide biosynthesis protein [Enterobacter kobei]